MLPRFPEGRTLSLSGKRVLASVAAMLLVLAGTAVPAFGQDERLSRYAAAVEEATQAMGPGEAGDWLFTCDNRAWCTVIGHDGLANPNRVVANDTRSLALRLWVDPQGQVARLEFIPDRQVTVESEAGIDWRTPFPLAIPNLRGHPVTMPFARGELGGTDIAAVVRFLRRGIVLAAHDPATGDTRLRLPWVGFADAMAQVRRRQRAVQRWLRIVQPDQSEVRLQALVPVMVSGVPPITAAQMDWCAAGIDAADLRAFDLGNDGQMWQHVCAGTGRNATLSRFFRVGPGEGVPEEMSHRGEMGHGLANTVPLGPDGRALVFRLPGEMGMTTAQHGWFWPNASVEADFGVIRSTNYSLLGQEDCGTAMVWGWTGQDWVVLEQRMMTACMGLAVSDWPVTWQRSSISAREAAGQ